MTTPASETGTLSADEIARRSGSNLAFALACLPLEKRHDMRVFYAFCRVVDDIADDEGRAQEDRLEALEKWRRSVRDGPGGPGQLESEVEELIRKYDLSRDLLLEIIAGVEMDIGEVRFGSFEELERYCYRVACVVGVVSAEIFGYRNAKTLEYAEVLGYALQFTNILRDVGQDMRMERRIYLPRDVMAAARYEEEDLESEVWDDRFRQVAGRLAERARGYYAKAAAMLPDEDRGTMAAAEVMRSVYSGILKKMEQDGYRVFEKRYRLSRARMSGILLAGYLRSRLRRYCRQASL
ncbi:MAG: squalene/phytoene synthase family protein [Verrucomicrobiota bacterium]